MLVELPSGRYVNLEAIAFIEPQIVKGLSGQLPITLITSGGAGYKLPGKDAKVLLEELQRLGLITKLPVSS